MSECEHDFEVIGPAGKYIRKKCKKCSRVILELNLIYRPYYKVQMKGSPWYLFILPENAFAEAQELLEQDDEQAVTIEKVLMTRKEVEALPEFPGY